MSRRGFLTRGARGWAECGIMGKCKLLIFALAVAQASSPHILPVSEVPCHFLALTLS